VVSVLIADLASIPLEDTDVPLAYGVVSVVCLFCYELMISGLTVKSIHFRELLFGRPSIIIRNGVIQQREMRQNRLTLDELAEELRSKDITDISTVKCAVLETDGRLNTLLFQEHIPPSVGQMGLKSEDRGFPIILINDGRLLSDNLKKAGRDLRWLQQELRSRGVRDHSQVFLLSLDEAGAVYFAAMEEKG